MESEVQKADNDRKLREMKLAADIAVVGEQAMYLNTQIHDIDERIANLYADADPSGIVTSAPGVGPSSPPSSPAASAMWNRRNGGNGRYPKNNISPVVGSNRG